MAINKKEGPDDKQVAILKYEAEMTAEHGPRVGTMTEEMMLQEIANMAGYQKCIGVLLGSPEDASNFRVVFDKRKVSNFEVIDVLKHSGAHFDNMRARGLMAERTGQMPAQAPPPQKG